MGSNGRPGAPKQRKARKRKPQRLHEHQRTVHGILVHMPGDGKLWGILCQEVYMDKEKAAWVGMMIQDGKAMEALGENGKPFEVVPEGTTAKLIPLTLIWDTWEDKPEEVVNANT